MGNCLRHESPMHWAGDDWDSLIEDGFFKDDIDYDKSRVRGDDIIREKTRERFKISSSSSSSSRRVIQSMVTADSSSSSSSEVKIKITKKQLEELLGKAKLRELSVQQVLSHLLHYEANQRSWRPVLQSIPEI